VFTPQPVRGKTFPLRLILEAVSLFNLGYSAEAACRLMSERSGLAFAPTTLANWVTDHQNLCSYARLRDAGRKLFTPNQIVRSVKLYHQQVYEFSIHRAKLQLLAGTTSPTNHFGPLGEFLQLMLRRCPHELFQTTVRASQAKTKAHFDLAQVSITEKSNFATRIAHLVIPTAPSNKLRHETLQRFMLANDSVTVATEVPIYLLPEDVQHLQKRLGFAIPLTLEHPLTGHIDFLQIRNGAIHILDYKPDAETNKPIEQLTLYALALSRLTGLRLFDFKCAWFNQNHYYEFFPLHVVHKLSS
jgi:ATP-dependent exoDNAse (exonuclease V) beta subunit